MGIVYVYVYIHNICVYMYTYIYMFIRRDVVPQKSVGASYPHFQASKDVSDDRIEVGSTGVIEVGNHGMALGSAMFGYP